MTRLLARIFLLLAVALLLAHYMPAFYDLLAAQRYRGPSFNYSQVERAIIATRPVEGGVIYVNIDSNQIYTREQYQEILPINNHALLMRQERMPTAIDGVALTRQAILLNRADLRVTPRDFQEQVVRMRPLLEAKDVELNLVMPPDFVRPGKQFTFLVPSGNSVDAALTQKFTDALLAAGFEFPVRHFANNPTTRKTFDDGMLLVDNRGQWFRLRREFGQPVIQPLDIGLSPLIIQVREQLNAEIRGLTVTEENELWLLVGPEF
ncbi:MAG: DUF4857 domain-containing protein [Verrucomicrobia bacterium]|nr:DUF4857 domain-containing protein [Verrucomicrobiota bacterium]